MADFTHFNNDGRPQMVNVGKQDETSRIAIASGRFLSASHPFCYRLWRS